ncbi:uncharacterized protein LOC123978375, partial [Micropterus dolomieu]|uniref:uncharacterized protein LOC123978375 n=1 Tax=Micropterus dolomieu TaxID=147949 RepID=UPI001E8EF369
EFKWISLFLTAVLQFTAAAEKLPLSFTVRVGDEVTLPCKNLIASQQNCEYTTWVFTHSNNTAAVVPVLLGQIGEDALSKSDRLSVTETCSLFIKKVTVEDVGYYFCHQYISEEHGPDSLVYLSVVTMTERKDADEVTLNCSVSTYGECEHTVKWLYEGKDVDKDMKTSQSGCYATVSFLDSHFSSKSNLKCEVSDIFSGNVQLFTFSPQSSGEKTARTDRSALDYIMLVMRVAELLLITVITVLLIRARGARR